MTRRQRISVGVFLAVALLVAGGVGLKSLVHVTPAAARETIFIGSDNTACTESWCSLSIQRGEAFAISRVGSVRGYKLGFAAYDDSIAGVRSADKGADNVQLMIAKPNLLAMIGPDDSAVARAEIPIANRASLAIVTPAAADRCLTVNYPSCPWSPDVLRPTGKNNFFRIVANDSRQGLVMADFAYDSLRLRTVAVWDDQWDDSMLFADDFAAEFVRKGGRLVARRRFEEPAGSTPDFRPWLLQAKAAGAEAVYSGAFLALNDGACVARAQSVGIFDSGSAYLGPGSLHDATDEWSVLSDDSCISEAGSMANDRVYATVGIGAAELNPRAAKVIAAYKAAHPDPIFLGPGTFAGYDCAMIVIDAIGRAIDANHGSIPTREQVRQQIARTKNFRGVTGTFTFDAAGDATQPTFQLLRITGDTWTPAINLVATAP